MVILNASVPVILIVECIIASHSKEVVSWLQCFLLCDQQHCAKDRLNRLAAFPDVIKSVLKQPSLQEGGALWGEITKNRPRPLHVQLMEIRPDAFKWPW